MLDLKICVACLETEGRMYNMDECENRADFNKVASLDTKKGNGLPSFLCNQCQVMLEKFKIFREKCHKSNYVLNIILSANKQITVENVDALDRGKLGLTTLSFLKPERSKVITYKFHFNPNQLTYPEPVTLEGLFLSAVNVSQQETKRVKFEPDVAKRVKKEQEEPKRVRKERVESKVESEFVTIEIAPEGHGSLVEEGKPVIKSEITELDNDCVQDTDMESEDADGMEVDNKYASLIELTKLQQKAVFEIIKGSGLGKYQCKVCKQAFMNEGRLKVHEKGHQKYMRGEFCCDICKLYYKSNFLLKRHIESHHLYKYLCKECPEVNYSRSLAKFHYSAQHEKKDDAKVPARRGKRVGLREKTVDLPVRRVGLRERRGSRVRNTKIRKSKYEYPKDFLKVAPIGHLEQYKLIEDRKLTKNYIQAVYKCELCFRGFQNGNAFANHQKKHDPAISGPLQCDPCKLHFKTARKLYKHVNVTHTHKYTCSMCDLVCFSRNVARMHYRWHNNVTYECEHCGMIFTKSSTRLTHIRIKHPSTAICTLCGHSFVSDIGLFYHKQKTHTKEEVDNHEKEKRRSPEPSLYCHECKLQFVSQEAFAVHLESSSKHVLVNVAVQSNLKNYYDKPVVSNKPGRKRKPRGINEVYNNGKATPTTCEECGEVLPNDVKARLHYKTKHPGTKFLKRYMCDVCGHTTQQYNNLLVHMRKHTQEKPYACKFCGKKFSMPSNRDRHIVVHTGERFECNVCQRRFSQNSKLKLHIQTVHTGEKRFECHYCQRRFSQSSALKLHIQTVHLKIPYAPWDKRNRRRRKAMEINTPQPEPKLHVDTQGEYINAYISYHD